MCFFGQHNWALLAKTVSPAPKRLAGVGGIKGEGLFAEDIQRMMRMQLEAFERDSRVVTCFLFQCSDCKALRKEELWGVVEERP